MGGWTEFVGTATMIVLVETRSAKVKDAGRDQFPHWFTAARRGRLLIYIRFIPFSNLPTPLASVFVNRHY
ncbi:hypothetical protein LCGC14_2177710, partial [marine sediment metagenome]